jgi:hypothetical protein
LLYRPLFIREAINFSKWCVSAMFTGQHILVAIDVNRLRAKTQTFLLSARAKADLPSSEISWPASGPCPHPRV